MAFGVGSAASTQDLPFGVGKATKSVQKTVQKQGQRLDKSVGNALTWAHGHPFDAFMAVAGAPQRALKALETGNNPGQAFMNPRTTPEMDRQLRESSTGLGGPLSAMRGVGSMIGGLERGALAGSDLPHRFGRGVLDTAFDVANDPVTYIPVGDVARLGAKMIPGLHTAADAIGHFAQSVAGKALDPEHHLAGFTEHGRATVEAIVNRARQGEWVKKQSMRAIIARNADAIRKGKMPADVVSLFRSPLSIPKNAKTPQEVETALNRELGNETWTKIRKDLKLHGVTASRSGVKVKLKNPADMFTNPDNVDEARRGLQKFLDQAKPFKSNSEIGNLILDTTRYLTHRGNQAFLAIPFPHMFNLINLSYQRHGIGTTLSGIGRAARVATGIGVNGTQLEKDIQALTGVGARSQYQNLFTEYGMNKILGSGTLAKAANKTVVIPFERFSNWLQQKFLNPMETGLRTAAWRAEEKKGVTGVEAARHIHQTFGTNPRSALTHAAEQLGTPFAQFHYQTVLSQGARALANDPSRIINLVKAQIDMNRQVNPGQTKFTPAVPGASFARAVTSPQTYFAGMAGPLYSLGQSYSALSLVQKGKISQALSKALGRYIPMSQAGDVLIRLATGQKGDAGESASSDILPIVTGGYYSKVKP